MQDRKNKLLIQWHGPFTVTKKIKDADNETTTMLHRYNEDTQNNKKLQDNVIYMTVLQEKELKDTQELKLPTLIISTHTESWKNIKLDNLSSKREKK